MNTLFIFGDESGNNPPLREEDGIFVGATITTQVPPQKIEERNRNPRWLVEKLQEFSAHPSVAYIRPVPGYGVAVRSKLEKMDIMARSKRLLYGEHPYLPSGGIALRNTVWMHTMQQAIIQQFISGLTTGPIDALEIVLDEKTLAPENRRLLVDQFRRIPALAMKLLIRAHELDAHAAGRYLSNMKVDSSTISVAWSNDPGASEAQGGLRLAHYLAWHYRRHLAGFKTCIDDEMTKAGFKRFAMDITKIVTAPISRSSIENWKRSTGLPEPSG